MHCEVHAAPQVPPEQTSGAVQATGGDQTPQPLPSAVQVRTPLPSHEAAPMEQPVGQVGPLPPVPPMSSLPPPPPVPPPPPLLSTAMSPAVPPGRLPLGLQPRATVTRTSVSARTRVMRERTDGPAESCAAIASARDLDRGAHAARAHARRRHEATDPPVSCAMVRACFPSKTRARTRSPPAS